MSNVWQETAVHERNMKIFREEFDDFLPDKILDFHVHVFPEGTVPDGGTYSCAGHPIAKYDLEDLGRDLADAYPGRETSAVCFGLPHVDYDRAVNDRYIAECCRGTRFFGLRLFDPEHDSAELLQRDLQHGPFRGLKPYWRYVRDDPESAEIHDMLPPWAMEVANDLGLIIMLHISKKRRLADATNQRQLVELCSRYPRAKIVLAHIGRAYFLRNIVGNVEPLRDLPNLWFDLAMVSNPDVLEHLFKTVGPGKILYATDTPIALAPGKTVEINDQYTYVTPVPWELSISDDHGRLQFTSFLYEELRGIKTAMRRLGLGRDFAEKLFFGNGMDLLHGGD